MDPSEVRQMVKMQNDLTFGCFKDCINQFRESGLTTSEKSCL